MRHREAVVLVPLSEYRKACQVLSAIAKGNLLILEPLTSEPILKPQTTQEFTAHDVWQTAFDLNWEAEETTHP